METVCFKRTGEKDIPAIVYAKGRETPVWIQSAWTAGEYAQYIRRNGCGHCCTAMAARLWGVEIDPYEEYMMCRQLWGAPDAEKGQDHFLTVGGIVKVLRHLNIPAVCYGVPEQEQKAAADHIVSCLRDGKQVILISDPFRDPGNEFSTGYHYVMAVGFDSEGRILIANSSENTSKGGIQLVTPETIEKALYQGGTADMEMSWGVVETLYKGCTYVVVG